MFDPFQMGLMTLAGAQNPDMFANLMAAQGISPSMLPGTVVNAPQAPELGGLLGGLSKMAGFLPGAIPPGPRGDGLPTPMPPPAAAPGTGAPGMDMISALGKVKAPEQAKPVFSGGVSGSQNAPGMAVGKGMSSGSEAILQALLGGGRGAGVPSLGMLLKGI